MCITGKKLLILGGTSASLNLVKLAKSMGVYTVVVDEADVSKRVAKQEADAHFEVSTTDIDGLMKLVEEEHIDGVFCGPSEFNIRNMIRLCDVSGLPCYTTMEQWNRCANKDEFTEYCRRYGVDVPEEYGIHDGMTDAELDEIDYPIIIKPVDGCSSVGISVCRDKTEVIHAYIKAMNASACKRIISQQYIDNGGELFGVRYFVQDGEAYPYLLIDTYVADPITRKSLISAYTFTPSKYSEYYLKHMDKQVRAMIKGMGIKKGTVFFQSLPYKGRIYFHEMGYRLSGGMIYKLTEPLMGINDMKMMIRCALGGECINKEEIGNIDIHCNGRVGAQLMIPLETGRIAKIEGLDEVLTIPAINDFIQYYSVGDTIESEYIGTLQQHFGRFSLVADSKDEIQSAVSLIQNRLVIIDAKGHRLNRMLFDLNRVTQ
ncbi:MAG: ATP-grasp domain-containing protein [Sphaerochaeta associata]|uniref:ATP-binding protein n=1 Tax=Sphaerochaeta associata TaxID=1129264 RepID=UPI002B214FC3|nr:ATP-grasp domain-containing protein [Sphaerochaeta associata]MEA5028685.1 ATP-grasp domain-containing protein [Sphaerochaeta associata]